MANGITLEEEVAGSFFQAKLDRILKRYVIDIPFASAGLLLSAPLIGIAALAIKLESKDPAFYSQKRVGMGGKEFTLYKSRTMNDGAENHFDRYLDSVYDGEKITRPEKDERVTKVGKVPRKLKIDELPQFYNVLKGDMSVVGPRPLDKRYYEKFPIPKERYSCPPGLTGPMQLIELSTDKIEDLIAEDMGYVKRYNERRTFLYDLYIILKTPISIIRGRASS